MATTAHQRRVRNDPTSTRNSPTNPLSGGNPIDDIITMVNTTANTGATFCRPRSAAISRVWRRSEIMPTRRNSAPVDRPWLMFCSSPPWSPWVVMANVPSTMKPRWATDE